MPLCDEAAVTRVNHALSVRVAAARVACSREAIRASKNPTIRVLEIVIEQAITRLLSHTGSSVLAAQAIQKY